MYTDELYQVLVIIIKGYSSYLCSAFILSCFSREAARRGNVKGMAAQGIVEFESLKHVHFQGYMTEPLGHSPRQRLSGNRFNLDENLDLGWILLLRFSFHTKVKMTENSLKRDFVRRVRSDAVTISGREGDEAQSTKMTGADDSSDDSKGGRLGLTLGALELPSLALKCHVSEWP